MLRCQIILLMAWCIKKGLGKQRVGKQTSGKILREKTDLKMARTGGYRRPAV